MLEEPFFCKMTIFKKLQKFAITSAIIIIVFKRRKSRYSFIIHCYEGETVYDENTLYGIDGKFQKRGLS